MRTQIIHVLKSLRMFHVHFRHVCCVDVDIAVMQIHKDGKKKREHIAAEPAPKAIANV